MKLPSPVSRKRARIEIIPLIDVVFFLLATFVMVSLSMVKNRGIPVNLPTARTAAPQEDGFFTAITITEGGQVFFDKEKITLTQLPDQLRKLKAENPDPRIVIHGDGKALFESAVLVLDEIRKTGITRVAVRTKNDAR